MNSSYSPDSPAGNQPPVVDTHAPHSARVWNYWLGGKNHYPVDREAGERFRAVFPGIVDIARASRQFLVRAVTFLAGEAGIRQFLDIGTGLPAYPNTHDVAQAITPDATIVYVDNDPLVLTYARALLVGAPEGVTDYIDADLREPETLLSRATHVLDTTQPVGLMLMGILGHISDYEEARSIVHRLVAALPAGSYLAHYDGTDTDEALREAQRIYDSRAPLPYYLRSPEQIERYYEGLEVLSPGVVPVSRWRPDSSQVDDWNVAVYGGVAHKPR